MDKSELFEVLKPMVEQGMTNAEMSTALNATGYRRGTSGQLFQPHDISPILLAHNIRRRVKAARGPNKQTAAAPKRNARQRISYKELLDIMSSNMADESKKNLLNTLGLDLT